MDQSDRRDHLLLSQLEAMAAGRADIEAGRLEDFDLYLARIGRRVDDALAEAERRKQAVKV